MEQTGLGRKAEGWEGQAPEPRGWMDDRAWPTESMGPQGLAGGKGSLSAPGSRMGRSLSAGSSCLLSSEDAISVG